jgi:hypothetical protein
MGATPPASIDRRTLDPMAHPLAIDAAPTDPGPAAIPMLGWPSSDAEPQTGQEIVPATASASSPATRPAPHTAPPMDEVAGVLQDVQAALARSRYVIVHGPNGTVGSEAYNLASLSVVTAFVVEAGVTTRAQLADVVDQVEVTASEVLGAMLWRPAATGKRRWLGLAKPSGNGRRTEKPASKQAATTRPSRPEKAPKAPKTPKAAKPVKPAKPAKKGATAAKPATPATPPRSVRLLRKKSPPVDGFVPSTPPTAPLASDDDADPGSRARPFDPAR